MFILCFIKGNQIKGYFIFLFSYFFELFNIAEKLMAHKRGLDGSYLKPTREQCFAEFVKAIPELTISDQARLKAENMKLVEEKSELAKIKAEVEELKKIRKKEDKVTFDLVSFYETENKHYLKNLPPEYLEYWRLWKALKASGKRVKEFTWPIESIPEEIKKIHVSN